MNRLTGWLVGGLFLLWSICMVAAGMGWAGRGRDVDQQELTRLRLKVEHERTQALAWRGLYLLKQPTIDTVYRTLVVQTTKARELTQQELDSLRRSAPADCAPVLTRCEVLIAQEQEQTDHWRHLFEQQREAAGNADSAAAHGIRGVDTAKTAIEIVLGPPKRSFFQILFRPKLQVGMGPFAGYCVEGKPCIGAGLVGRLAWDF